MGIARKVQTAELGRLFKEVELQGQIKGRNYLASDTVFSYFTSFIDRSFGFAKKCDVTRMNAIYTKMVGELLFSYNRAAWTAE